MVQLWPTFTADSSKVVDLEKLGDVKYVSNPLIDQEIYRPLEYTPEPKKNGIMFLGSIIIIIALVLLGFGLYGIINLHSDVPAIESSSSCIIGSQLSKPIHVDATSFHIKEGELFYSAILPSTYFYCDLMRENFYLQKGKLTITVDSTQQKIVNNRREATSFYNSSEVESYTFNDSFDLRDIKNYNLVYEVVDIIYNYNVSLSEDGPFSQVTLYRQFIIEFTKEDLLQIAKEEESSEEYENEYDEENMVSK